MRSSFLKKKYPEKLIDNEMNKVRFFPANLQNKKFEKVVPFVVTYHLILNSLSKIIQDNVYLLYMNEQVTKTFSPGHMISFQSARKLWFWLSCIHCKEICVPQNVVNDDVKFVIM